MSISLWVESVAVTFLSWLPVRRLTLTYFADGAKCHLLGGVLRPLVCSLAILDYFSCKVLESSFSLSRKVSGDMLLEFCKKL